MKMHENLSPKQIDAALLLAAGQPIGVIAASLDIDPTTLYRWRKDSTFQAYLHNLLRDVERESLETLRALRMKAVEKLGKLLDSSTDTVALKAVEVILSNTKAPFSAQPELVGEGEKRAAWAAVLRQIESSLEFSEIEETDDALHA